MPQLIDVPLIYGGQWSGFDYLATQSAVISVPIDCEYKTLCGIIFTKLGVSPREFSLILKFGYGNSGGGFVIPPVLLNNDSTLEIFLRKCASDRQPLVVDMEPLPPARIPSLESSNVVPEINLQNEGQRLDNCGDDLLDGLGHTEVDENRMNDWEDIGLDENIGLDEEEQHIDDNECGRVAPELPFTPSSHDSVHIGRSKDTTFFVPPPLNTDSRAPRQSDLDSSTVNLKDFFLCKKDLLDKMKYIAIKSNFEFIHYKSTKSLLVLKCKSSGCQWYLRATAKPGCDGFTVTRLVEEHSCNFALNANHHPQAGSQFVAEMIMYKYQRVGQVYRPKDIQSDLRTQHGSSISYHTAWRAREKAMAMVRGYPEDSYALLPGYAYMLERKNPGTFTFIERSDDNHFKYFFMAIGVCLSGFRVVIRPVIAVDACHMKGKYGGVMFIAVGMDGNGQIYPIAFGLGDSENDASWEYFLSKLHLSIGNLPEDVVFVSDWHKSIEKAVKTVFPSSFHVLCIYHLNTNIKAKFKNDDIASQFFVAAKKYRRSEFHRIWSTMQQTDPEVCRYLEEIGVNRWARAYQDSRCFNIMTKNIAECMNGILRDAREMPVTYFAEHMRGLLQRWHYERREAAHKTSSALTTNAQDILVTRAKESMTFVVEPVDRLVFVVKDGSKEFNVDLKLKQCTCRVFDLEHLPCSHAIAGARVRNINIEEFCSAYYMTTALRAAYARVMPVGPHEEWDLSEMENQDKLLPPITRRPSGRRRKQRIPSNAQ